MKTLSESQTVLHNVLSEHLHRISAASPDCAQFINQYLDSGTLGILVPAALEKLALSQSDSSQHSFALSRPPVFFNVTTLPIDLAGGRDWFTRACGGYLRYLDQAWSSAAIRSSNCSVWCHVICGPTLAGFWVQLALCSIREPRIITTGVLPIDFLSAEERKSVGL
jgi:hypothetical protein